jgi:hypothetical protein
MNNIINEFIKNPNEFIKNFNKKNKFINISQNIISNYTSLYVSSPYVISLPDNSNTCYSTICYSTTSYFI